MSPCATVVHVRALASVQVPTGSSHRRGPRRRPLDICQFEQWYLYVPLPARVLPRLKRCALDAAGKCWRAAVYRNRSRCSGAQRRPCVSASHPSLPAVGDRRPPVLDPRNPGSKPHGTTMDQISNTVGEGEAWTPGQEPPVDINEQSRKGPEKTKGPWRST